MDFLRKNKDNLLVMLVIIIVLGIGWLYKSTISSSSKVEPIKYSVDDSEEAYKTLSYQVASDELNKDNGFQAFYIGCRNCSHCLHLEESIKQFLAKYQDKNANRDLIYKIEAGFNCIPDQGSDDYSGYEKVYQFLVNNKKAEANSQKGFGTPHFHLVKDGKIIDSLDNYSRTVEGIEDLFRANNYRGFNK